MVKLPHTGSGRAWLKAQALVNLQTAYHANASPENKRRLEAMTLALVGMFVAMRKAYAGEPLEPDDRNALWVMRFLAQFDAIFTLNQDTLLEDYYAGNVRWNEKWSGSYLPYMEPLYSEAKIARRIGDTLMTPAIHLAPSPELQPYYKLHGSFTWYLGADRLLVMGGIRLKRLEHRTYWHDTIRNLHNNLQLQTRV